VEDWLDRGARQSRCAPDWQLYISGQSGQRNSGAPTQDQDETMIYLVAALLPPLGLLLNGQPLAALLNLILMVPCLIFGLIFHVLLLVPSILAIITIYLKREERRHREIVNAIERHGPRSGLR